LAIGNRTALCDDTLWPEPQTNGEAGIVQLYQILQELPALMQLSDNMVPSTTSYVTTAKQEHYNQALASLGARCSLLQLRLTSWYTALEMQNQHHYQGQLHWPKPSTLYARLPQSHPARDLPFETFLCFPNADIAQQVILSWTGSLLTHSTLQLTKNRILIAGYSVPLPTSDAEDTLGLPYWPSSENVHPGNKLAHLITRSIEYLVHPDMGYLNTSFLGFSMAVAQQYYRGTNSPELAWFDVISERLRQVSGT
jgi:hypothetical protein